MSVESDHLPLLVWSMQVFILSQKNPNLIKDFSPAVEGELTSRTA